MADISGVCAIVPRHQDGFRPKVIGMGILVDDCEVVTCAHVIDAAIGEGWFDEPGDGVVRVCFPFVEGSICVNGTVDRSRYFRPDRAEEGKLTDIAVVRFPELVSKSAGRAVLRNYANDARVKVYGFRQKEQEDGSWSSHPDGEIVESTILGPLPGGRVYFEGLRSTGAAVEPGFSGAGVYDPRQGAVVGMVVVASTEAEKRNAQFIDAESLRKALGWTVSQPPAIGSRTASHATLDEVQGLKRSIEEYLQKLCETLSDPDPDGESPLLNYLRPILVDDTTEAETLRAAFGFLKNNGGLAKQLYRVVSTGGDRAAPYLGLTAQRMNHLLWRLELTLRYIPGDWAKEGRKRAATIRSICDPHLLARQPTLRDIALVFKFSVDQAAFAESAPDPTLYSVLRAFEYTQSHLPPDKSSGTQTARHDALEFLHQYLRDLLDATRPLIIHDSSNAWWAVRTGFCEGDDRFRTLLPEIAAKYGDVTAPPSSVSRRAAVPEIYKPLRTASYTLSNAQAIVEHDHDLDAELIDEIHRIIHVMLNRLLVERWSKQLYLASVHHEGLRNYLDYVKDQRLEIIHDPIPPRNGGKLVSSDLSDGVQGSKTIVSPIRGVSQGREKLFISYSHSDEKFLTELLIHLKPLERAGIISKWSDKQIAPGSQWFAEIQAALASSKVALMLVTPAFLASDFIHEHELGPLLKQAEEGGTRILWVPVRACSYKDTPLARYQAVIDPEKPLAQMKAERDQAWVKACEEIKRVLQQ